MKNAAVASVPKCWLLPITLVALNIAQGSQAKAEAFGTGMSSGRLTIMEENDRLTSETSDRHYTQGLRLSYLSKPVMPNSTWDRPYDMLSENFSIFNGTGTNPNRKYEWTLGQSIFTPTNITRSFPSPGDRPYAGWLYVGAGLLQETDKEDHQTLENAELLVGVVGPAALGEVTQNDFHQVVHNTIAKGWRTQLENEPGIVLSYERKWRFPALAKAVSIDFIPTLGASIGNVLTYGETGGMVRIGQNLGADYGPNRIRPSLSGTAWFNPDKLHGILGWYLFLGLQGRIVGRNIFLDGNSFAHSRSVNKKLLVCDLIGGASVYLSSTVRIDFTVTERTKEFFGQSSRDRFGGVNLSFDL